jgi:hypothetical protein
MTKVELLVEIIKRQRFINFIEIVINLRFYLFSNLEFYLNFFLRDKWEIGINGLFLFFWTKNPVFQNGLFGVV